MKAIVTGGSRGIGKAIAKELLLAGHEVMLVAQHAENLIRAQEELESASKIRPRIEVCDLSRQDEILALHDRCKMDGFAANVLVLNAGIFLEGTLLESRAEDFERTLQVNLVSIYHFVKTFIPTLRTQPYPRIFLTGSTAALEPYKYGPLYGVAKWALKGYATNLREELKEQRVGVTLLTPGGTLTDLWDGENLPPNRLLEPEDIGKVLVATLTLSEQAVVEEIVIRPMLGDMHD